MSKQIFYEFLDGETSGDSVYLISLDDIAVISPCKDYAYAGYSFSIKFKQGGGASFHHALGLYRALLKKIRSEAEIVRLQDSGYDVSAMME